MQMLGGRLDQALPDQRWVIIGSKGPVTAITDIRDIHVVHADERTKVVADTARAIGVSLQRDLVQSYGDDSAAIQATSGGVPAVNLVVPARYTHAHNGIIDRADFDRTVDLVVALIRRLDANEVARGRDFTPG